MAIVLQINGNTGTVVFPETFDFGEEVPDIKDLFTELMKMRFKIFRKIRLKM